MQPLNKATAKILEALTNGLSDPYESDEGSSRKIDNAPNTFMAVSVQRLSPNRYSVTHYYEQNGDLVPDPDCEFFKDPQGGWYPIAIQHNTGHYSRAIELNENEIGVNRWWPRAYNDLRSFVTMWMRNIREQQNLKVR